RRVGRQLHTSPRAFLDVKIDGRYTFFEWVAAGRYASHNERGTMATGARNLIKDVYFGFNPKALLVRVDFDGPARTVLADFTALRIGFADPPDCEVLVPRPEGTPTAQLCKVEGSHRQTRAIEVGIDQVVELAIPFEALGVQVD